MNTRPNLPRTSIESWGIKKNGISTDHRIIRMALEEIETGTYRDIHTWILNNFYKIRHKTSILDSVAVARRLSEMERLGMIEKTGAVRNTPSKRKANVYTLKLTQNGK